jgi:hypothetical protein
MQIHLLNDLRTKNMHPFPISFPTQRSLYLKPLQRHNLKFQLFPKITKPLKINNYFYNFYKKLPKFFSKYIKNLYFTGFYLWKSWKYPCFPTLFQQNIQFLLEYKKGLDLLLILDIQTFYRIYFLEKIVINAAHMKVPKIASKLASISKP